MSWSNLPSNSPAEVTDFRSEWQRLAPAREFAAALLRHRAQHNLDQPELGEQLGVSHSRIVELESGEHNPSVDTLIAASRQLGIEFALDVAPSGRDPGLATARAQSHGAIEYDGVSVLVASAS